MGESIQSAVVRCMSEPLVRFFTAAPVRLMARSVHAVRAFDCETEAVIFVSSDEMRGARPAWRRGMPLKVNLCGITIPKVMDSYYCSIQIQLATMGIQDDALPSSKFR